MSDALGAAGFSTAGLDALVAAFGAQIARGRLPGAVLHAERHGRVALHVALGRLDPARDTAMPLDAIFRIFSMTKPVVSVAAMRLVEAGRLRLDQPVADVLPSFAGAKVLAEIDGGEVLLEPPRSMTLHDLLRHTAGLTYEWQPASAVQARYAAADLPSRSRTLAELVDVIGGLPLQRAPGSGFEYSRATDVLGRVVEVVAGEPLGEHLRRAVFAPLGMLDTGFHVPVSAHARIAEPFASDPDGGEPVALPDMRAPVPLELAGSGLVSTTADYARFVRMLLEGGTLDGARILGRKTVEWMFADHLGAIPVVDPALPPGHGFGLGVAVRLQDGVAHVPGSAGTVGWGGASGTVFFVDPVERLLGVLMTQAPMQREEFQQLFRTMLYAAVR